MGKVIPVDFRYYTRREEMEEIQDRVAERIQYFAQFGTFTEEQRKQSQEDAFRVTELKNEAREWNDQEFLEEWE